MPDPRPAPYDGRHTRTTSWSTAREMRLNNNEPQRAPFRRRDSDASSHSVSDTVPARRSVEWRHHHARSVSQSQTNVQALQEQELPPSSNKPARVTWMSLPRKGQLALLGLCRVFDFLQIASLQAYMFYQLKSFDETLSDSEVSTQAGILQGAFTAAQFATAIPWGRVADAQWGGRKFVLLVGLIGTAVSCLGVAFATSFAQAVFWRSFGGAINGTVGLIRTMIAENVKEKKYHSRAFLILPIGFNIAALFGPVMGGLLSDPVKSYPNLFGPNSPFGGATGVQWLMKYPYALPMLVNCILLTLCAVLVAVGLEETLEACKGKPGLGAFVVKLFVRGMQAVVPRSSYLYSKLPLQDHHEEESLLARQQPDPTESYELEEKAAKPKRRAQVLPFRRIWTKNVLCTLLAQAFFDFQMGAFNNLWLLFLSTPRYDPNDPSSPPQKLPFIFTGGLGMPPQSVGFATSIPRNHRYGSAVHGLPHDQRPSGHRQELPVLPHPLPPGLRVRAVPLPRAVLVAAPGAGDRRVGLDLHHRGALPPGDGANLHPAHLHHPAEQLLTAPVRAGYDPRHRTVRVVRLPDDRAHLLRILVRIRPGHRHGRFRVVADRPRFHLWMHCFHIRVRGVGS